MTVNIHGKNYKTVAERLEEFRKKFKGYKIITELISRDEQTVVMKAIIYDNENKIASTGYAEEIRSSSLINKTSALENCETSAVGRALAFLGLAGTEIASADEVANAIKQQNAGSFGKDVPVSNRCAGCNGMITDAEKKYSITKFKKCLCRKCQSVVNKQ